MKPRTKLLFILAFGATDIRTDVQQVEHNDIAVKMRNRFWQNRLLRALKTYDSDKVVWTSGYISFDLPEDNPK